MCHHPLLFLRLEPLSHRQVHIFSGWVIWCSIMQMSSSILALVKLVIKSMIYGYSSVRGTNTLYVKRIRLIEMQCASAIWYETDDISSCWLQCCWCELCISCFHNHDGASLTHTHFRVYSCYWPPDLPTRVLSIRAHLALLCEVKHGTCSPALPGVWEDPDHALLMTCQTARASHTAA